MAKRIDDWAAHCERKINVCKNRLAIWAEKLKKWESLSQFATQEEASKIAEVHRLRERLAKLENETEA